MTQLENAALKWRVAERMFQKLRAERIQLLRDHDDYSEDRHGQLHCVYKADWAKWMADEECPPEWKDLGDREKKARLHRNSRLMALRKAADKAIFGRGKA